MNVDFTPVPPQMVAPPEITVLEELGFGISERKVNFLRVGENIYVVQVVWEKADFNEIYISDNKTDAIISFKEVLNFLLGVLEDEEDKGLKKEIKELLEKYKS